METTTETTKTNRKKPTKKEVNDAARLIKKTIKENGPDSIRNIAPLAFSFEKVNDSTGLEDNIVVKPVVNPLFDAVMIVLGYDRLGSRSYTIGAGEDLEKKVLLSTFAAVPAEAAFARVAAERFSKNGIDAGVQSPAANILAEISRAKAADGLSSREVADALGESKNRNYYSNRETESRYSEHAIVSFSSNGSSINLSVATAFEAFRQNFGSGIYLWPDAPNLHTMPIGSTKDPVVTNPYYALAMLETAKAWGFETISDGFENEVEEAVLIRQVPGSPGEAKVVAFDNVVNGAFADDGFAPLGESRLFEKKMTAFDATTLTKTIKRKFKATPVIIDDRVSDVVSMSKAKPSGKRDGLRPYQDEAVALHLSTEFGYVNACAPGLGKTVMALQAMREKAEGKKDYRGLITCPASIRSQWLSEIKKFFPEAKAITWAGKEVEDEIDTFFKSANGSPAIVLLSYDAMRVAVDTLETYSWDDIICDEAAILKNHTTRRSNALWQLRSVADVAVALTGTPINKSLDDLGNIVSWVRDDRSAFHGKKLSRRFDMARDEDIDLLWDSLGPTVFRRDRSEIADQLPDIDTEVISLDPEPEELALANGARDELKKIYATLQEKLKVAQSVDPDNPALKEAQSDMKQIRGAVLGGTTLARMAASDPAALENSSSATAGIALLKSAGLIEPALKSGGTKRKLVSGLVSDLTERGDSVLIFTDFSSVAETLVKEISSLGVKVGSFTGKNSGKKREEAVKDFQDGKLDCLVLTGAGREGLNLQRASVLIHYDLPWVPSQVVQRIGRASRFGSTSSKLSVLIPIMKGTIEENVAGLLVPRAIEALRALDSKRGVDGKDTEIGIAISGLEDAAPAEMKENNSLFSLAEEIFASEEG